MDYASLDRRKILTYLKENGGTASGDDRSGSHSCRTVKNRNRQNVTKLINSNRKFKKTVNLIEFLHLLY